MVARFFRDITQNRIRRGAFHSVRELVAAIDSYVSEHNREPKAVHLDGKGCGHLEKVTRARRSVDKVRSE